MLESALIYNKRYLLPRTSINEIEKVTAWCPVNLVGYVMESALLRSAHMPY